MRGLVLDGSGARFVRDLPEPAVSPAETRVRVLRAGVCATDLALARGYMGFRGVPGHEFVGEALDGPLAGRRVVGEINAGCGRCGRCRAGQGRHCAGRSVLGILGRSGAFAERLALPTANLHPVPDGVPTDVAVFAEPLAAAFEIPAEIELAGLDRACVVGDGRLGLLCAQVLALSVPAVDLLGRHPERAALLRAARGASAIRHRGDVLRTAGEAGERWPLVVEATGDPGVLQAALGLVEPRGTLALKTTSEAPAELDLAPLVVDEIRLQGSRCGPFPPALAALAAGSVAVRPLVDARFPLEEAPAALERAAAPGTLKVLIDVDATP